MTEAAPVVASPKAKKVAKPKKPMDHPPFNEMIVKAIQALKERGGSSRQAIAKYIAGNFNVGKDEKMINAHLRMAFKRMVANKALVQVKGSFKIGEKPKVEKPKKVKVAKAAKPKSPKKEKVTKKPKSPKKEKPAEAPAAPAEAAPKPKKAEKPKKEKAAKKPKSPKAAKPKVKSAKPKKEKVAKKVKSPKKEKKAKSPKKAAPAQA